MPDPTDDIVALLTEVRSLLVPISACFEEPFAQICRRREKLKVLQALLTENTRRIYPLLFDPRRLAQADIAKEAGVTQPTVSKFLKRLRESGLVEEGEDDAGATFYRDKFALTTLMEESNDPN